MRNDIAIYPAVQTHYLGNFSFLSYSWKFCQSWIKIAVFFDQLYTQMESLDLIIFLHVER